ncbi:hypothetical protein ACIRQP_37870 [Streptomyces sp. NPDC102274]|uniref:hypothetical protein n=1 Tax=Streptomyces sp. NPDC102274 TaxID=3366151 RepID=UPI00382FE48C
MTAARRLMGIAFAVGFPRGARRRHPRIEEAEHGQLLPGFKLAMLTITALAPLGVVITLPRLAKTART